jgi:hypothetical protein
MRRRALLAASQTGGGGGTYDDIFGEIPPESTEFGWPLYITVPFNSQTDSYRYYYKEPSSIVGQLYNWFFENAEVTEHIFETYYDIYDPDIYINGVKVGQITCTNTLGTIYGPYLIISDLGNLSCNYVEIIINVDNSIEIKLYK